MTLTRSAARVVTNRDEMDSMEASELESVTASGRVADLCPAPYLRFDFVGQLSPGAPLAVTGEVISAGGGLFA